MMFVADPSVESNLLGVIGLDVVLVAGPSVLSSSLVSHDASYTLFEVVARPQSLTQLEDEDSSAFVMVSAVFDDNSRQILLASDGVSLTSTSPEALTVSSGRGGLIVHVPQDPLPHNSSESGPLITVMWTPPSRCPEQHSLAASIIPWCLFNRMGVGVSWSDTE